jgi:hypothetical protein
MSYSRPSVNQFSSPAGNAEAGPSNPISPARLSSFKKWRRNLSVAGRRRNDSPASSTILAASGSVHSNSSVPPVASDPYMDLRPAEALTSGHRLNSVSEQDADGYEWEPESDSGETDLQGDAYNWVNHGDLGTSGQRDTVCSVTAPLTRSPL